MKEKEMDIWKIVFIFSLLIFGVMGCSIKKGNRMKAISIIPKPLEMTIKKGEFELTTSTKISVPDGNKEIKDIGTYFTHIVKQSTGYDLEINEHSAPKSIMFRLENLPELGTEGYRLIVKRESVLLIGFQAAGLFYGIQTLCQLLPTDFEKSQPVIGASWKIPCVRIEDKPAFKWRGLMLDCSRTFLSKDYIMRYIDLLAIYKLNTLHLHLTDDQGWRLEIKKYPKLTEICSKFDPQYGGEISGYYSQDDMKEIIEYAKIRYINIVPEIEMPGHSSAVFAAFPELSCRGEKTEIFPFFKGPHITKDILCVGNDVVFRFLENVLTEVVELFPSPYIHIGGDEAPKDRWKECPKCQQRIQQEGLKDEYELQSYFIKRMAKFLNSRGRKLIGWDEILEGGLTPEAAVMSWRGMEGGVEAANMGHEVVMSPTSHCYFDYDFNKTPLDKTYAFLPIPGNLTADKRKFILGGQANMWTHIARTESAIDQQIFPRLLALAEALWIQQEYKDFGDFYRRKIIHDARLKILGVEYDTEANSGSTR